MAVRLVPLLITDRHDRQLAVEVGPEYLSHILQRDPLPPDEHLQSSSADLRVDTREKGARGFDLDAGRLPLQAPELALGRVVIPTERAPDQWPGVTATAVARTRALDTGRTPPLRIRADMRDARGACHTQPSRWNGFATSVGCISSTVGSDGGARSQSTGRGRSTGRSSV